VADRARELSARRLHRAALIDDSRAPTLVDLAIIR
jgi:hypothetical protein